MDVQTTGRLLIFSLFKRQKMISQIILTILATIFLGSLLLPPTYEAYTTCISARPHQPGFIDTFRPG